MEVPEKIVSGGQTGADRAALDWAIEAGIPHGGWCPAGRRAEDGAILPVYQLNETPQAAYIVRTELNVRDSDGTAVISISDQLRGGSLATFGLAREMGKPVVWLSSPDAGRNAANLREFVKANRVKILNVAGPRQSQESGIYDVTMEILRRAFG